MTVGSFNLPLTQQHIAKYLGLTVVQVTRAARALREQKIVMIDNQVVMIRNMAGLRRLAGGGASRAVAPSDVLPQIADSRVLPFQPLAGESEPDVDR